MNVKDAPEKLRPYLFHGLDLNYTKGEKDAVGDCVFCGRDGRFSIKVDTGQWQCLKCMEKGNIYSFLDKLLALSIEATSNEEYDELAADRRLLFPETLVLWNIGKSVLTDKWIIPGFNVHGKVCQLYKYTKVEGRMALLATPTLGHQLLGMNVYNTDFPNVHVCEGVWDSMSWWETIRRIPEYKNTNVLGIPSATVFKDIWTNPLAGKNVSLMVHNDHNKKHPKTGQPIPSVSYSGASRIAGLATNSSEPCGNLTVLNWSGGDAVGPSDSLPSGYDLRDALAEGKGANVGSPAEALKSRITSAERLIGMVAPAPEAWLITDGSVSAENFTEIPCAPCSEYKKLSLAWKKALKWTEGLDSALTIMLACVASTKSVGEQLWVKILGPPSCGKTTLVEGIAVASRYVVSKSTLRGFHSGFKVEGGEDTALIAKLKDKTLAIKDGDTLLKSPNLSQILSEARDIYDRTSRTHYRNAKSQDYTGIRMTWILCGTSALREIDDSELGARFIDCIVMEGIDDEFEDEVGWRVANQEERNMAMESDEMASSQYDPALTEAMSLTGGYVEYLRSNATRLYSEVEMGDAALRRCVKLGKFIAHMRARPNRKKDTEDVGREFAARLVKQQVRLAKSVAIVLNKKSVDEEVLDRVTKVALDTSRGLTLQIVELLSKAPNGLELRGLVLLTNRTDNDVRIMLRFLRKIGVVQMIETDATEKRGRQKRWYLTDKIHKLYLEVKGLQDA